MIPKILCLLKSGYIYNWNHVEWLFDDITKNIGRSDYKIDFVCLSDVEAPFDADSGQYITRIPLQYNLPRQWSQIEVLRPDVYPGEDIWYFDLDTRIVSPINDILFNCTTDAMLDDFYKPGLLRSGVMHITWETRNWLWKIFAEKGLKQKQYKMQTPNGPGVYSVSKGFWNQYFPQRIPLQSFFPDRFISFKSHAVHDKDHCRIIVPKKASVMCFHGLPKDKPMQDRIERKK